MQENRVESISEKVILIRISQLFCEGMSSEELYEATRGVWRLGNRKNKATYVFSIANGEVKEVYKIQAWSAAASTIYKTRPKKDVQKAGRWEFTGTVAVENIRKKYIGKSIKHFFAKGAANPTIYINC